MSLLSFNNVGIRFGNRQVITDFSAEIDQGEFIGIFGPNGVGKSTLLRSILGLSPLHEGSIDFLGNPPGALNSLIGYLPQAEDGLEAFSLSARALVAAVYRGERWGLPWLSSHAREEVEYSLELAGASEYAHRPFSQLSGGEKKRIMLAQALLNHPKLLLLDEPLASLDPKNQFLLVERLLQIREEQALTMLFIAHDVNPLLGAMTRVMYLGRGRVALGSVDDVISSEALSSLYGMNIHVLRSGGRLFIVNAENNIDETTCSHA